MSPAVEISVRAARWQEEEGAIAQVRRRVFIQEQGVPEAMEWESEDAACQWFVAVAPEREGEGVVVLACGRLTAEGRIGRMAVLAPWRRCGVGSALLAAILEAARARGLDHVFLSAQTHALAFYERFGFRAQGDEYLDAGIPHQTMTLDLT